MNDDKFACIEGILDAIEVGDRGDSNYMKLAYMEAIEARDRSDVPIGAVLVINNEIICSERNYGETNDDYFSHAENLLIQIYGKEIRNARKGKNIELYTTLEPCFMCFGAIVHNRINRLVYACPDSIAGVTNMDPPTNWYNERWPIIDQGPLKEESYKLMIDFIEKKGWGNVIEAYKSMQIK